MHAIWPLPVAGVDGPGADAVAQTRRNVGYPRVVGPVRRAQQVAVDTVPDLPTHPRVRQSGEIRMGVGVVEHPVPLLTQRTHDPRVVLSVFVDEEECCPNVTQLQIAADASGAVRVTVSPIVECEQDPPRGITTPGFVV